ncbi:hypothetical protein [Nonomuraea sp. B19D2]|uniref:hypothetical protein n=1 Tax=Nonomuraea sp. B19D2 TaxID=3159561 RepID=UPI0032D9EC17
MTWPYAMMTGLGPRSALEAVRLQLTADRPERTAVHAGEEWVYVVHGQVLARGPATVIIVSVSPPPARPPHGPAGG